MLILLLSYALLLSATFSLHASPLSLYASAKKCTPIKVQDQPQKTNPAILDDVLNNAKTDLQFIFRFKCNPLDEEVYDIDIEQALKYKGYDLPTNAQVIQIKTEALKIFGAEAAKKIVAASMGKEPHEKAIHSVTSYFINENFEYICRPVISLCVTPDYNGRLGALYHEFGHIVQVHGSLLDHLESDLQRFEEYKKIGAARITRSTQIGNWINNLLELRKTALYKLVTIIKKTCKELGMLWWQLPLNKEHISFKKSTEIQADIFCMDKLFDQNRIDPLLSMFFEFITDYGQIPNYSYLEALLKISKFNFDDWQEYMPHPGYIDRALAIAGFLESKGFDINALLKTWEKTGVCIDHELQLSPF